MSKSIELQFHWIFILIAGAVILSFFSMIALKQYEVSKLKREISFLRSFETVFESALKSGNVVLPPLDNAEDVLFYCSEACNCEYVVEKTQRKYDNKILIAPSELRGGKQTMWVIPVKIPFKVTNILLLYNHNVKLYFIYEETSHIDAIKKELPENLIAEFIPSEKFEDIKYEGYYDSRFVFVKTSMQDPDESFNDQKISAVVLESNFAEFYEKDDTNNLIKKDAVFFYPDDKAILFAIIFASDKNMFSCAMQKIYSKLESLANIYLSRIEKLEGFEERCYYTKGSLTEIESIARKASQNNIAEFARLSYLAKLLEQENKNMADVKGCPAIY